MPERRARSVFSALPLLAAAVAALIALAAAPGVAVAQALPTVTGPLPIAVGWRPIALDVSGLPSGTSWAGASVQLRFSQSTGAGSNQVRWALASAAMSGTGSTLAAPEIVYAAPPGAMTGSSSSASDATLVATTTLADAYGGNPGPLVLNVRMVSGAASVGSVTVTLSGAAPHPDGVTCDRPRTIATLPFAAGGASGVALRWAPAERWAGPGSACGSAAAGAARRSYWSFTAPASGPFLLSTCSSDVGSFGVVDTTVTLYRTDPVAGPCAPVGVGGSALVACSDNSGSGCAGLRGSLIATLTGGEQYLVVVSSAAPGPLTGDTTVGLAVRNLTPPPASDSCASAAAIPGAGPFPWLSESVSIVAATPPVGQAPDPLMACPTGAVQSVWWSFTPAGSGRYEFSTCEADAPGGTAGDAVVGLMLAAGGAAGGPGCAVSPMVACGTFSCGGTRQRLQADLVAGVPVLLCVGRPASAGPSATGNTVQVLVRFTPAPPVPSNDTCAGAIELPAVSSAVVTEPVDVRGAGSADEPVLPSAMPRAVWYALTPAADGMYEISTCPQDAPGCTLPETALAVLRAGAGPGGCGIGAEVIAQVLGPMQSASAGSLATGTCPPRAVVTVPMVAGQRYLIALGAGSGAVPAEGQSHVSARVVWAGPLPAVGAGTAWDEFEPNDTRATPQDAFALGPGDIWVRGSSLGATAGAAGATGPDYWRVVWALGSGVGSTLAVWTVEAVPAPRGCEPHRLSLRGFTQAAGQINGTSDAPLQTGAGLRWYAVGQTDGSAVLRVDGSLASPQPYCLRISAAAIDADAELDPVEPGQVTLSTVGAATVGGQQTDTDLWLYDSSLLPISGAGSDDADGTSGSRLTVTLFPGTYTVALAAGNLANAEPSPPGDGNRDKPVAAWLGAAAGSDPAPAPGGLSLRVIDTRRTRTVTLPGAASPGTPGAVVWVRLVVRAGSAACSPADIAATDGLPGADGQIDNGDFQAFFESFFSGCLPPGSGPWACGPADIAATDAAPGADGQIDNGDFQAFFGSFFDGCGG